MQLDEKLRVCMTSHTADTGLPEAQPAVVKSATHEHVGIAAAGFWGAAISLLGMASARGTRSGVLATTAALGCAAFARGGFSVNHMDIAPGQAGMLMGVSNTAGTFAGESHVYQS